MTDPAVQQKRHRVYLVTCIPTQKRYVGITSSLLKYRWRSHVHSVLVGTNRTLLGRAIKKHGEAAFTIAELVVVDTRVEAAELESKYITELGTFCPDGMNMTLGGEGTAGVRNKHSEETKRKMSVAAKGKKKSPEHIRNMGISAKGRRRTEADKQQISSTMKERWSDPIFKERGLNALRRGWATAEYKEKKSKQSKAKWVEWRQNPEIMARMRAGVVKSWIKRRQNQYADESEKQH